MGIYVIRYEGADIEDSPADVGVVLEGEKVIQDLCSVPYATAMLLGLIYGLNLYPPELRYTFEVLLGMGIVKVLTVLLLLSILLIGPVL